MTLARFGVRKPVVANLVMFALIGAGLIFGTTLRREFFPYVEPRLVIVTAPYPGAAPEEVESALAKKIEDRVADLTAVKEINSTVSEGAAVVSIEFEEGTPIDKAVADVKREMDALQDLPPLADRITVDKLEPNLPAIVVSISGDADERTMKDFINEVREDLLTLDEITDIALGGVRGDEMIVEVGPERALEQSLSLTTISDRIGQAMAELPGGSVRGSTSNVAVRSMGVDERADEILDIPLTGRGDGGVVRVRDVATVTDGFVDSDLRTRFNGEPAMTLTVFRVGEQDILKLADKVKAYTQGRRGEELDLTMGERARLLLARIMTQPGQPKPEARDVIERAAAWALGYDRYQVAPPPGKLENSTDLARFVRGRLELLTRNALQGGALVFLVLVLLLNWRVSFWVALGLVVSLLGTLALMSLTGVTLNLLTMFGLIIVIGILVDDAIVVAENITARHEKGEVAAVAAVRGTDQVSWPVVSTVLTTICAFLPLALLNGQIGDFLGVLPIVVAAALSISLVETLFILPVHMSESLHAADRARLKRGNSRLARLETKMESLREGFFKSFLIPKYARLLQWTLHHRYVTVATSIAVLMVSLGMLAGGIVKFSFLDEDDAETVNITVNMPIGTAVDRTDAVVSRLEDIVLELDEVQSVFAQAGAVGDINGEGGDATATHLGQLIMELTPVEDRDRPSPELIRYIQKELGEVPEAKSIRMEGVSGGPGGPDLSFTVIGEEGAELSVAVDRIKQIMEEFDGVFGIADDADSGKRELRFTLRDGAAELGFTRASLGRQIQGMVLGLEAHTFAGEREDVDVRVIATERVRRSLASLERQFVFTPDARAVPLGEVARIEEASADATIRRLDRKRAISVTADVNAEIANTEELAAEIGGRLEAMVSEFPGVEIIERGRQKDVADSFESLPVGMAVAAGLIYVILAWLFGSFSQPLAVMAAIPFGLVGMIWGHLILGFNITFLSLIGFIALSGVVVNDSLILMEFFNAERKKGKTVPEAGLEAGRARVRAILLTTVTTVFGLLPLMLEQSFQARFLIPMAITIAFGLISATGIILLVLPSLLMVLDDVAHLFRVLWTGRVGGPRHNPFVPDPELAMLDEPGPVRSPDAPVD